jgi:hypothetical protein
MTVLRFALFSAACAILVACGGASSSSTHPATVSSDEPQAASVWRSKCGSCHVPVEPGSHTRDAIETALQRHHKRVRLSDEQWTQLVDFLAPKEQAKLQ